MSQDLWDISDGQKVIKNKTPDDLRAFLANCPVPREQIKIKPAGAARRWRRLPKSTGSLWPRVVTRTTRPRSRKQLNDAAPQGAASDSTQQTERTPPVTTSCHH